MLIVNRPRLSSYQVFSTERRNRYVPASDGHV